MMFLKSALTLLLAANTSAFVVAPARGSCQRQLAMRHVALSDPTASSEVQLDDEIPVVAETNDGLVPEENVAADTAPSMETESMLEPSAAEEERHTIYMGNLPYGITMDEIKAMFTDAGVEVKNVNLPRNKQSGEIKGFAFVDVGTEDEITKAVEAMDGISAGDRSLRVSKSLEKDQIRSKKPNPKQDRNKLFVGNVPFKATKEDLRNVCAEFGDVVDVFIPVDSVGEPRGFAFVTCTDESVEAVMEGLNGAELMGRSLIVKPPLKPGEKEERKSKKNAPTRMKVYVGNLSFYTNQAVLAEVFEEFGEVHDCYIPEDVERGGSRGFGFVTMDEDAGREAIEGLNGIELDGREISVNEAKAKRRSARQYDNDNEGDN